MLNRRHLRVKVLQCLYAFFQSDNDDLASGEKELFHGIEMIFDLYLFQMMLLVDLAAHEEGIIEGNMMKRLPTYKDLHPNKRLSDNKCLQAIAVDERLQKLAKKRNIYWNNERELVRKLMMKIREQPYYQTYMEGEEHDLKDDTYFLLKVINKSILPFEDLHAFYEEKSIYWIDDWELVNMMIIKTLKNTVHSDGKLQLMELYKDPSDQQFARELFRKTVVHHESFNRIISEKTVNWDVERIAMMDMIIMEMALTEILKFSEIPVKVSLNEYIELSKMYSTPKSRYFVNGILDKLVEEFVREGKISGNTSEVDGGASE